MDRLLSSCRGKRVGVIVNEFGEINIDARLLENNGIKMSELSNGSIFCACIKENFLKALIEMSSHLLDYVLIEASGLADPSNMPQILHAIRDHTIHPYDYLGSICVLDGESFLELDDFFPAIRNQLTHAGVVLINKEDLISTETKAKIRSQVKESNPNVPVYFTRYCNINIGTLFDNLKPSRSEGSESTNTLENRPQSFILKVSPSITMGELQRFFNCVAPYTYRLKGFACVSDQRYFISGVRSHVKIIPWNKEVSSFEVVLISSVGLRLTGILSDAISQYASKAIQLV